MVFSGRLSTPARTRLRSGPRRSRRWAVLRRRRWACRARSGAKACGTRTFEKCAVSPPGRLRAGTGARLPGQPGLAVRPGRPGAGGSSWAKPPFAVTDDEVARDNEVSDCHIHDGGRMFHSAIGVWIGQSPGNRLSTITFTTSTTRHLDRLDVGLWPGAGHEQRWSSGITSTTSACDPTATARS